MSKYDVYGIGGALLDTEYQISNTFLRSNEIEHGSMTLINHHEQSELEKRLARDYPHIVKKCGGSVCNSIVAASSLGAKTCFSGKVGIDVDGEFFIHTLEHSGVDSYCGVTEKAVTGKCVVLITEDAERTMQTYLGASEFLSSNDIDEHAIKNSKWIYIEGYLLTSELKKMMVSKAIEIAKKNSVKVALSLSDRFIVEEFGDFLRDVIGDGIDFIFCNKEEALSFTRAQALTEAEKTLKKYTKTFAITNGASGAIVFDGGKRYIAKSESVNALDTNGAGDMFAGAFIYAITNGKDYRWASKLANYCASRVVLKFGPRLDHSEFSFIKSKFGLIHS